MKVEIFFSELFFFFEQVLVKFLHSVEILFEVSEGLQLEFARLGLLHELGILFLEVLIRLQELLVLVLRGVQIFGVAAVFFLKLLELVFKIYQHFVSLLDFLGLLKSLSLQRAVLGGHF